MSARLRFVSAVTTERVNIRKKERSMVKTSFLRRVACWSLPGAKNQMFVRTWCGSDWACSQSRMLRLMGQADAGSLSRAKKRVTTSFRRPADQPDGAAATPVAAGQSWGRHDAPSDGAGRACAAAPGVPGRTEYRYG